MRILIAPDKFKGCLPAGEVAKEIATGMRRILPRAEIDVMPIADGGDGTAEVMCDALGGSWVTCRAHDPIGRQIECRYALVGDRKLAIVEMSEAAGMRRLTEDEFDPLRATTFGVGQLILDAARRGAHTVIVGLGGSATNDGGFGLARAFGFRFFDGEGMQVRIAINKLRTLKQIDSPRNFTLPRVIAAADVQNPLYGRRGATRVFGPQKGATTMELLLLEKCLKRLGKVASRQIRRVSPKTPGAGAAGGLGFGLMVFAGAALRPGFELVAEMIGLESRVQKADVIITGEGRLDEQTAAGKAPAGVLHLARRHHKQVFAIVGESEGDAAASFDGVWQLLADGSDRARSIAMARELLRIKAGDLAKQWQPATG